ncbi:MAG: 16S rRNA (cytosine(1402)-N(4))-methyltransferase RsmH, partial [Clostridia bacterium]|nr:16S rRNA (cytosine(1402)-N(4))-methyltransferase RsmH [Clostridia bacterium]
MRFHHLPVLLSECLNGLSIKPTGVYLDCTLGGAGHSSEILKRLGSGGLLIGIDRDETAVERAGERLRSFGDRVRLVHGSFAALGEILDELSIPAVDGMIFDLGVSSPQLDEAERGFSYRLDAPLDMRMDRSQT